MGGRRNCVSKVPGSPGGSSFGSWARLIFLHFSIRARQAGASFHLGIVEIESYLSCSFYLSIIDSYCLLIENLDRVLSNINDKNIKHIGNL